MLETPEERVKLLKAGMKVLVVEDDKTNMELITFILKHYGYEPIEAFTGEEGIEKVTAYRPDLILMDINLPGIDGLETSRRIRKMKTMIDVPIIAVTSSKAIDIETILNAGCNGRIQKPINPLTINDEIMRIIEATIS